MKNKTLAKLLRLLITLLGAGVGLALAAAVLPLISRLTVVPLHWYVWLYAGLALIFAVVFFACSNRIIDRTIKLIAAAERRMGDMPMQQIVCVSFGLLIGLFIAALLSQLILSMGASLLTLSFSGIAYLVLGCLGMRVGNRRGRDGKRLFRSLNDSTVPEMSEPSRTVAPVAFARKLLDTSVIIDGRIADIVKTGFLEGELVVPQFVLAELRHIADSSDSLRRARGRRGLDVLTRLQKDAAVTLDETDYTDVDEVDVKLLRLCRDTGGAVVTNDYNLNKVASVTGLRVLNINDLSNAIKPMLTAGEELQVQLVREGKEPGQGVAYLDDGTMIVVENGRRSVGQTATVVVTTVLQTSAGRMIFCKMKDSEDTID